MPLYTEPFSNTGNFEYLSGSELSDGVLKTSSGQRQSITKSVDIAEQESDFLYLSYLAQSIPSDSDLRIRLSPDGTQLCGYEGQPLNIGSYDLNGVNQYIQCADDDSFSFNVAGQDQPFSLVAWVYIDSFANNFGVCLKRNLSDNSDLEYTFYFGTDANLRLNLYMAGASIFLTTRSSQVFKTGQWYRVVATYDGSESPSGINLYANGFLLKLEASSASGGTYTGMTPAAGTFNIGAISSTLKSDGKISDVIMYDRELSSTEVLEDFAHSNPPSDFIHRWKFNGNANDSASSGAINGSPQNSPTNSTVDTDLPPFGYSLNEFDKRTLYLDGVNDYALITNYNDGDMEGFNWTINFWTKTYNSFSSFNRVFQINDQNLNPSSAGTNIAINGGDYKIFSRTTLGSPFFNFTSFGSPTDNWDMITITWNESDTKLRAYVNGTLGATSSAGNPNWDDHRYVYLGRNTNSYGQESLFANYSFATGCWDASQISKIYQSGYSSDPEFGFVQFIPLTGNASDIIGGNHGSVAGGVYYSDYWRPCPSTSLTGDVDISGHFESLSDFTFFIKNYSNRTSRSAELDEIVFASLLVGGGDLNGDYLTGDASITNNGFVSLSLSTGFGLSIPYISENHKPVVLSYSANQDATFCYGSPSGEVAFNIPSGAGVFKAPIKINAESGIYTSGIQSGNYVNLFFRYLIEY